MKFLGEFIQHFVSRFRNDIFLEDVSSGTIASGGNLGIDSNNKIVKANVPTSHDAVTLTGTPDYITISGQEITRNQIDLANDVTGTLAAGNVATLNQDTTGNAATATALTSGDKTIEGNLRIGGSGDTSNNWITIDAQNGDDASGGGICFYETGTDTIGAPQFGAKIVYNEDDDELAIGTMHSGVFKRQIHMDRGSSSVRMQNVVLATTSTDGPFLFFQNDDTSVVDGQSLCRIIVRDADRGTSTTTSQIQWFATEDHDSNSGGTKIVFSVTPNGNSQSETVAMTIDQDSSISIPGSIELGHASDTTISRSAAGKVRIEGEAVVTTLTESFASGVSDTPIATKIARRTLTTAEMNALHTTPIQIVPAQGSNIVTLLTGGMIRVDRASTNSGTGNLDFHYEGLEPAAFGTDSLMHFRRFHNSKTTDGVYNLGAAMPSSSLVATTLTEDVNKAIEVSLSSAATTNCFTSVDIYLTYQLIKIA